MEICNHIKYRVRNLFPFEMHNEMLRIKMKQKHCFLAEEAPDTFPPFCEFMLINFQVNCCWWIYLLTIFFFLVLYLSLFAALPSEFEGDDSFIGDWTEQFVCEFDEILRWFWVLNLFKIILQLLRFRFHFDKHREGSKVAAKTLFEIGDIQNRISHLICHNWLILTTLIPSWKHSLNPPKMRQNQLNFPSSH